MRQEIEKELSSLQPLSPAVMDLMTFEGFSRWYNRMQHYYPTKEDAYEALEYHYKRITGRRRYSEMKSFYKIQQLKSKANTAK